MEEYRSNTYKSKEASAQPSVPEKKTEAIAKPVKVKKRSEAHKLKDIFISDDASNVKNYILLDVLVPAIKKAVKDIVTDGIEMILYGESGRRSGGGGSSKTDYVSYSRYSDRDDRFRSEPRAGTGYSYNDITLRTRGEAEDVLRGMDDIIDRYKVVSVADLYDLVGITGDYTDQKYGWTNLSRAEPIRVRDGYMLRLPKALPIN